MMKFLQHYVVPFLQSYSKWDRIRIPALCLVLSLCFISRSFAQYDYGTGADGAFTSSGNATLSGTKNYTSFTINSGDTVNATGGVPLIIKCTGNVVINGVLMATGGPGISGNSYNSGTGMATGGAGGQGGGGGWGGAGGSGGNGVLVSLGGTDGNKGNNFFSFTGGGYGGHKYGLNGSVSAGTGGSYGTLGGVAPSTQAPSVGNTTLGSTYSDNNLTATVTAGPITTNLLGGSGGGGGGGRSNGGNTGFVNGGDGGGGGGGAIQITANTITFGANALLSVRGGDGGGDVPHGVGAGGGGSGGTILLQYAQTLSNATINTTPVFANGTIDIAGGIGGKAALINGSYYYTIGGDGGQGRYLQQQDPNSVNTCSAPTLTAKANGTVSPATVCSGTVLLTSNGVGGGGCTGQFEYAWSNGSLYWDGSSFASGTPVYNTAYVSISPSLSANGTLTVYGRCSANTACTSNQTITINVGNNLTPSVTINTPQKTTICAGTTINFTASPTNGGTAPTYQWMINSRGVGNNSTNFIDSTIANGDTITCVLTSNAGCASSSTATSNLLIMQVRDVVTPTVSISTPQTTICQGQQITITSAATNEGIAIYQWMVDGLPVGGNTPTLGPVAFSNHDTVICLLTSGVTCASPATVASATLVLTVSPKPNAGTITADNDTVCAGSAANLALINSTGNIQWQSGTATDELSNIDGSISTTLSPNINQTTYYQVVVTTGSCTDTTGIFTLYSSAAPTVSFTKTITGQSVAFDASASTGATGYTWDFGDGGTSTDVKPTHVYPNTDGTYHVCVNGTNGNCVTSVCQDVSISVSTGVHDLTGADVYSVYPTPFTDYVVINIKPSNNKIEAVEIYNVLGQQIISRSFSGAATGNTLRLDIPVVTSGAYYLRVKTTGVERDFIQPLIKQ